MDNGPDDYCSGCSSFVDNIGRLEHLRARDTNLVVVSKMPFEQIQDFAKRMEWSFPFVSSRGTTFADDCGAGGGFGISAFLRGDDGSVYQSYFTSGRGGDRARFDFNMLASHRTAGRKAGRTRPMAGRRPGPTNGGGCMTSTDSSSPRNHHRECHVGADRATRFSMNAKPTSSAPATSQPTTAIEPAGMIASDALRCWTRTRSGSFLSNST